jgi:hypothetical protein
MRTVPVWRTSVPASAGICVQLHANARVADLLWDCKAHMVCGRACLRAGEVDGGVCVWMRLEAKVQVRYVIDFYSGKLEEGKAVAYHLDVRPALDSYQVSVLCR